MNRRSFIFRPQPHVVCALAWQLDKVLGASLARRCYLYIRRRIGIWPNRFKDVEFGRNVQTGESHGVIVFQPGESIRVGDTIRIGAQGETVTVREIADGTTLILG